MNHRSENGLISRVWGSAVAWSMGPILMRVAAFVFVMTYALRTISRENIGLWYGMISLTALVGCIELGFATTIARFAAYYRAGARSVPPLGLHQDGVRVSDPNLPALRGIIAEARRIYLVLALVFLIVCIAAAMAWSALLPDAHPLDARAAGALGLLIAGGAFNLTAQYWPPLLNGLGEVRTYNVYQTIGQVAGYVLAMAGLWAGGGLVALAVGQVVQGLVWRWLSRRKVASMLVTPRDDGAVEPMNWRILWPMTWRSGVGMAASQLVLPVLPLMVSHFSLLETASFGFSLQVALLLHLFSSSWMAAIWPHLSALRVRGEMASVHLLAARRIAMSVATFVVAATIIPFVAPVALEWIHSKTPFLPTGLWALLAIATLADMIVGAHIVLLQTGNRTPYMSAIVATGLLNVGLAVFLGPRFATQGILLGAITAQLLIAAWWIPRRAWRDLRAASQPA